MSTDNEHSSGQKPKGHWPTSMNIGSSYPASTHLPFDDFYCCSTTMTMPARTTTTTRTPRYYFAFPLVVVLLLLLQLGTPCLAHDEENDVATATAAADETTITTTTNTLLRKVARPAMVEEAAATPARSFVPGQESQRQRRQLSFNIGFMSFLGRYSRWIAHNADGRTAAVGGCLLWVKKAASQSNV